MNIQYTPLILSIIGLILCLCGYKIQKVVITLTWFLLGFNLSASLLPNIISSETTVLITSLVIGVITGIFGFKLEKLALFITVSYLSYLFLENILQFDTQYLNILIRCGGSLLIGALSIVLLKPILITVSILGGVSIIYSNLPLLIDISSKVNIIICIIIIIISFVYQLKTTK